MGLLELIEARKAGERHTEGELQELVGGAMGAAPDYQVTAWLMAQVFRPLSLEETAILTRLMAESGERLDLSKLPRPWLDKHSTGGVGDKTSIVLLPLLAACGATVVKMSGRGLGITGGTIDKLESIPGMRLDLTPEQMLEQAGQIGIALGGQSSRLAPADGALYALRDATATVDSLPLIVSSILSKKLAGGSDVVSIDVKCGSGAMMRDLPAARELASALVEVGRALGLQIGASITDMSQPLGRCVGNALEVREAVETLSGTGEPRFTELCLALAGRALEHCGIEGGRQRAEEALASGRAAERARMWFAAQGASVDLFADSAALPQAPVVAALRHEGRGGFVSRQDARAVGLAAVQLGAGRVAKGAAIDHSVGIEVLRHVGDQVQPGDECWRVHAASREQMAGVELLLRQGFEVVDSPVSAPPLFFEP